MGLDIRTIGALMKLEITIFKFYPPRFSNQCATARQNATASDRDGRSFRWFCTTVPFPPSHRPPSGGSMVLADFGNCFRAGFFISIPFPERGEGSHEPATLHWIKARPFVHRWFPSSPPLFSTHSSSILLPATRRLTCLTLRPTLTPLPLAGCLTSRSVSASIHVHPPEFDLPSPHRLDLLRTRMLRTSGLSGIPRVSHRQIISTF